MHTNTPNSHTHILTHVFSHTHRHTHTHTLTHTLTLTSAPPLARTLFRYFAERGSLQNPDDGTGIKVGGSRVEESEQ